MLKRLTKIVSAVAISIIFGLVVFGVFGSVIFLIAPHFDLPERMLMSASWGLSILATPLIFYLIVSDRLTSVAEFLKTQFRKVHP